MLILDVLFKVDLNDSWVGIKISIMAHKLPIEKYVFDKKIGVNLEISPMYL